MGLSQAVLSTKWYTVVQDRNPVGRPMVNLDIPRDDRMWDRLPD